jgi:very-short-patch-repair endonuclease
MPCARPTCPLTGPWPGAHSRAHRVRREHRVKGRSYEVITMHEEAAHRHPTQVKSAARELRQPQTAAEQNLWERVRDRKLGGLKFRRQHPIGRFIADFYCAACSLVIELDGESHAGQAEHDAGRTEWLQQHGYRVLRFANHDIEHGITGVLETILRECGKG